MTTHAPAYPHDDLAEIAPDVYIVRGSLRLNPLIRISRNMTIVRDAGELTLVNPVRVNERGVAALRRLGRVRRIVSLGALHGLDDRWYRDHFGVETWARPGSSRYPAPADHVPLDAGGPLPFADARLFCFGSTEPESAILIERGNGLLLTCDALQHYGDYHHMSPAARVVLPFIGFPKRLLVGPIWLKAMTPPGGSLRPDFERLLEWKFDSLMAAHGSHLPVGAHRAARAAVEAAFG